MDSLQRARANLGIEPKSIKDLVREHKEALNRELGKRYQDSLRPLTPEDKERIALELCLEKQAQRAVNSNFRRHGNKPKQTICDDLTLDAPVVLRGMTYYTIPGCQVKSSKWSDSGTRSITHKVGCVRVLYELEQLK